MAPRGKSAIASTAPKGPPKIQGAFDSLIERLKQGNALELEFIKKLKDGLDFIANGMQTECFNRSDALSELRKKMGEERAKLDPASTAERKTNLGMLLQTEIEECEAAVVCNESRYTSAQCKAHADFEREMKYVVEVDRRDGERATRTQELLDMVIAAFPQAREGVEMWIQMERERTAQDIAAANLEASSIRERRDKRLEELRAMYEETKKVLIAQKECLKQVAKIGGVELYET